MQTSVATYKHTIPAVFCGGGFCGGIDPRREEYAGEDVAGVEVPDYASKYDALQDVIKDNYATFEVDYYGADNDNYVAGDGFCCGDNSMKTKSIADDSPNYEKLQYYYHSDHLGSASYITNLDGEVVQHIEYVPFGEVFLEEHNNTWNTPFLFNGKELDEETGLYYYGARYYNPRISLWYGVDPLNEERYGLSPYQYCQNNPVMLVDPTGMLDTNYKTEKGKPITSTEDGTNHNIIVPNDRLEEFQQNVNATPQDMQNSICWNNYWRDEFGGAMISAKDNNLLRLYKEYSNEEEAFTNFMQNPSLSTFGKALGARILNQTTSVESWATAAVLSPSKSVAKGTPKYLYHYTNQKAAQSISQNGLRVGRDGFSYLTNKSTLSPLQAQIELALPVNRALPNSLLRINTSGLNPVLIRRVQGNLPRLGAGGGTEILFNQTIPANSIKIIK